MTRANQSIGNLLGNLHKCAQQDENFTTESFAFVLRYVSQHDSAAFKTIVQFLTREAFDLTSDVSSDFQIKTQTNFSQGTPDILITHRRYFILIEVKVESPLSKTQLDRYREIVKAAERSYKSLITLTRYPIDDSDRVKVDSHVLWRTIGETMNVLAQEATDPISRFLMRQFVDFLKERRIWMDTVGWELERGVNSLVALIAMVEGAIQLAKTSGKNQGIRWDRIGYYFRVATFRCWAGVYFENSDTLLFKAYDVPIHADEALRIGAVEKGAKDLSNWVNERNLAEEEAHFFSRTPENQQAFVQKFIADCCEAVERINPPK